MIKWKLIIIIGLFFTQELYGAKILGIFPIASKSHYNLGNALMRGLAEAGHDVTMVSPHNDLIPTKNGTYRNVVLTGFQRNHDSLMKKINFYENVNTNSFLSFLYYQKASTILIRGVFEHPNIKTLLNSSEIFDVVIVEQIACEALKYFAYHFKSHLVLFSSIAADSKLNYVVGNPTMLSYTPQVDTNFSREMNFYQRIYNTCLYIFEAIIMHYYWIPFQDQLIKEYIPDAPPFIDINNNVSLILTNSHESIQQSIPLVRNIIPIGGFHIKPSKPLPRDLQEYLDESLDEGVIYVSFGSTLKSANLPDYKMQVLLNSFGSLKQKILWKFEDESIKNLPPNVRIGKWFPQMDILAHPNVRIFVTQGGLLSLIETIYNAVPVLIFPVFGDQAFNAHNAVLDGYGLSIDFHSKDFTEENIVSTIEQMLNNANFTENAQKKSKLFQDRQIHPLQEAVYWIEYVIRHNGAPHLGVAGVKLPWYQHYLVDVITVISGLFFVILYFILIITKLTFRFFKKRFKKVKKIRENKIKTN